MIITGIIVYTIHLPNTAAAESDIADSKQSSARRVPVTLVSFNYQNSRTVVSGSPALEAQVTSHGDNDTSGDQLMSRGD